MSKTYFCHIKGTVQGVGFRPFIFLLAKEFYLCGWVRNDSDGVKIKVNTTKEILNQFLTKIKSNHPKLSQIESIEFKEIEFENFENFEILQSDEHASKTAILPPDVSICEDCKKELFDPFDRRFGHPFISCTNCGVRYTMIKNLPYDRCNTSMDEFDMCEDCAKEYQNPSNRRYFAQTIGCNKCGPRVFIFDNNSNKIPFSIHAITDAIKNGKIVAIKGVGGYHLVCDATNDEAVLKLRNRKKRPKKPFAVMVKDLTMAKQLANLNAKEEEFLDSIAKPIVLLEKVKNSILSNFISLDIKTVGIFMPYTPLHLLILEDLQLPIVATSANISGEPLATNFDDISKLKDVWDMLIEHDRKIINGCDDSVIFELNNKMHFIRRARGYAPNNFKLTKKLQKKVLALGANQKNTISIGFDDNSIISPFIGDLGTLQMNNFFIDNIKNLKRIYDFEPEIIICDKHPNYESTKYAKKLKSQIFQVQHHYAHILGAKEIANIKEDVIGVAFDGTGYGDDGKIWGGEFFVLSQNDYKRVGHFKYFKLLGGDKVSLEPRRSALSILFDLYGENSKNIYNNTINAFTKKEIELFWAMWSKNLQCTQTSSCGRIFDAVASLLGICQISSYEGEAGMMLENFYDVNVKDNYSFCIDENSIIDLSNMFIELASEKNITLAVSKFFNTLIKIVEYFALKYKLKLVCAGGVFQNKTLCKLLSQSFVDVNFAYNIPSNDGGISFGQIVYATTKLNSGEENV